MPGLLQRAVLQRGPTAARNASSFACMNRRQKFRGQQRRDAATAVAMRMRRGILLPCMWRWCQSVHPANSCEGCGVGAPEVCELCSGGRLGAAAPRGAAGLGSSQVELGSHGAVESSSLRLARLWHHQSRGQAGRHGSWRWGFRRASRHDPTHDICYHPRARPRVGCRLPVAGCACNRPPT